jgi:hypothetical protein
LYLTRHGFGPLPRFSAYANDAPAAVRLSCGWIWARVQ